MRELSDFVVYLGATYVELEWCSACISCVPGPKSPDVFSNLHPRPLQSLRCQLSLAGPAESGEPEDSGSMVFLSTTAPARTLHPLQRTPPWSKINKIVWIKRGTQPNSADSTVFVELYRGKNEETSWDKRYNRNRGYYRPRFIVCLANDTVAIPGAEASG